MIFIYILKIIKENYVTQFHHRSVIMHRGITEIE